MVPELSNVVPRVKAKPKIYLKKQACPPLPRALSNRICTVSKQLYWKQTTTAKNKNKKQIWTFLFLDMLVERLQHQTRMHRSSSQPPWVRFSKPLTLQMSTPHHCENWCFWAVQSGVEHSWAENIRAQQRTERQAHPPLEGSNLYHLTLKDLWV